MKKEFKVQVISEKVEILEVNGQTYNADCLVDCCRQIWYGSRKSSQTGCNTKPYRDAFAGVSL